MTAQQPEPDDYSWSASPIHDRLLVELFSAALGDYSMEGGR